MSRVDAIPGFWSEQRKTDCPKSDANRLVCEALVGIHVSPAMNPGSHQFWLKLLNWPKGGHQRIGTADKLSCLLLIVRSVRQTFKLSRVALVKTDVNQTSRQAGMDQKY